MRKEVMIGEINDINRYRLNNIKKEYYQSFITEFSSFSSFIKWSQTIKRPLLGGKYLAVVFDDGFYNRMLDKFAIIDELKSHNDAFDLVMIVNPRDPFSENLPFKSVNFTFLRKTFKEDFIVMLTDKLELWDTELKDDIIKEILNRIGYSIADFQVYEDDLKLEKLTSPHMVKKIIKERKIAPIHQVLEGVLQRKKPMLREHYRLCSKYGNTWVTGTYIKILKEILKAKAKLRDDKIKMVDVRKDDKIRNYANIIRDIKTIDIFVLKWLLSRNAKIGIEQYYMAVLSSQVVEKFNLNQAGGFLDVKETKEYIRHTKTQ